MRECMNQYVSHQNQINQIQSNVWNSNQSNWSMNHSHLVMCRYILLYVINHLLQVMHDIYIRTIPWYIKCICIFVGMSWVPMCIVKWSINFGTLWPIFITNIYTSSIYNPVCFKSQSSNIKTYQAPHQGHLSLTPTSSTPQTSAVASTKRLARCAS